VWHVSSVARVNCSTCQVWHVSSAHVSSVACVSVARVKCGTCQVGSFRAPETVPKCALQLRPADRFYIVHHWMRQKGQEKRVSHKGEARHLAGRRRCSISGERSERQANRARKPADIAMGISMPWDLRVVHLLGTGRTWPEDPPASQGYRLQSTGLP
jgi:hypothetical protein